MPLNTAAVAALTVLEPNPARRVGRVFKRQDGRAWEAVRTAFERTVERAGLENFRFHDLRYTCASHMVMRGRSLKEVQEVLGYRSYAIMLPMRTSSLSICGRRWRR